MTELQLPEVLRSDDDRTTAKAVETLQCYYGVGLHSEHRFTGARFDTWDSTGLREENINRFTADDLVAVSLLSVEIPGSVAISLLDTEAAHISALLEELGPDRDLVEETEQWDDEWVGWRLSQKLRELPDVGATTASKLLARKRPRLRPIYDTKVADVIGLKNVWEPLRDELQTNPGLHDRLLTLRATAGLDVAVSAIRVFDVLAWMQGADKGCGAVRKAD